MNFCLINSTLFHLRTMSGSWTLAISYKYNDVLGLQSEPMKDTQNIRIRNKRVSQPSKISFRAGLTMLPLNPVVRT